MEKDKEGKFKIIPFEDVPITTITTIHTLNAEIYVDPLFYLFPVVFFKDKYHKDKINLPKDSIISLRHKGKYRGLPGKSFSCSMTIDLITSVKKVSAKLYPKSIHICGVTSNDVGNEASSIIISYINEAQKFIDKISSDVGLTEETLNWLKKITKGDPVKRPIYKLVENVPKKSKKKEYKLVGYKDDHTLIIKNNWIPPWLDMDIINKLYLDPSSYGYYGDYIEKLDWIKTIKKITSPGLGVSSISTAMVNYNYSLGFNIDRFALNDFLNGKNGFYTRFSNSVQHNVAVELPYDADPPKNKRKNSIPHYTFMVYKSGRVTQSGPSQSANKDPYYKFINTILEIMPHITYKY